MAKNKHNNYKRKKQSITTVKTVQQIKDEMAIPTGVLVGKKERLNLVAAQETMEKFNIRYNKIGITAVKAWKIWNSHERINAFKNLEKQYGNTKTLFHGTKFNNIESIIENGLQPGSSNCMFGKGIYLGNIDKAASFCGTTKKNVKFLIEVEAILGKTYSPRASDASLNATKLTLLGDYNSVFCNITKNPEWVIYNKDQVLIKYVYEITEIQYKQQSDCYSSYGCDVAKPCSIDNFKNLHKKCNVPTKSTFQTNNKHVIYICDQCILKYKLSIGSKINYYYGRYKWMNDTGQVLTGKIKEQM